MMGVASLCLSICPVYGSRLRFLPATACFPGAYPYHVVGFEERERLFRDCLGAHAGRQSLLVLCSSSQQSRPGT